MECYIKTSQNCHVLSAGKENEAPDVQKCGVITPLSSADTASTSDVVTPIHALPAQESMLTQATYTPMSPAATAGQECAKAYSSEEEEAAAAAAAAASDGTEWEQEVFDP